MPRTLAPDAYDALYALLDAAPTITVPVFDSEPPGRIPNAYLLLTGVSHTAKGYASIGAGGLSPQEETFDLDGEIRCWVGGSTNSTEPARVRDLAYTVLRAVDDVVQAHLDLGLAAVSWAVLSSFDLVQSVPSGGGRLATVTWAVSVSAYLTR